MISADKKPKDISELFGKSSEPVKVCAICGGTYHCEAWGVPLCAFDSHRWWIEAPYPKDLEARAPADYFEPKPWGREWKEGALARYFEPWTKAWAKRLREDAT